MIFIREKFFSNKNSLCCLLEMHLYCNNLSTIATISWLLISEVFLACFSCSNNFRLSHKSLGSDGQDIVEIPEAMTAGELSILLTDPSLVFGRPIFYVSKFISFANSPFIFQPCGLEVSAWKLKLVISFKRSPSSLKDLLLSLKFNILLYRVTVLPPFVKKMFLLVELRSFLI